MIFNAWCPFQLGWYYNSIFIFYFNVFYCKYFSPDFVLFWNETDLTSHSEANPPAKPCQIFLGKPKVVGKSWYFLLQSLTSRHRVEQHNFYVIVHNGAILASVLTDTSAKKLKSLLNQSYDKWNIELPWRRQDLYLLTPELCACCLSSF